MKFPTISDLLDKQTSDLIQQVLADLKRDTANQQPAAAAQPGVSQQECCEQQQDCNPMSQGLRRAGRAVQLLGDYVARVDSYQRDCLADHSLAECEVIGGLLWASRFDHHVSVRDFARNQLEQRGYDLTALGREPR